MTAALSPAAEVRLRVEAVYCSCAAAESALWEALAAADAGVLARVPATLATCAFLILRAEGWPTPAGLFAALEARAGELLSPATLRSAP